MNRTYSPLSILANWFSDLHGIVVPRMGNITIWKQGMDCDGNLLLLTVGLFESVFIKVCSHKVVALASVGREDSGEHQQGEKV